MTELERLLEWNEHHVEVLIPGEPDPDYPDKYRIPDEDIPFTDDEEET